MLHSSPPETPTQVYTSLSEIKNDFHISLMSSRVMPEITSLYWEIASTFFSGMLSSWIPRSTLIQYPSLVLSVSWKCWTLRLALFIMCGEKRMLRRHLDASLTARSTFWCSELMTINQSFVGKRSFTPTSNLVWYTSDSESRRYEYSSVETIFSISSMQAGANKGWLRRATVSSSFAFLEVRDDQNPFLRLLSMFSVDEYPHRFGAMPLR
mmetsp:Transcript_44136/g.70896  ORF Transcript_44136/g.70896 Transcript_44136/m.70896 type:complete len:210 (-) Transcript_44136:783-1412(-)